MDSFEKRPCIDKNGDINYSFLMIRGLINPKYLTNLTIFLGILCLIFKYKKGIHIVTPLMITNGIFISIYCFLFLHKFDIEGLKYICPIEYKEPAKHKYLLQKANQQRFIGFYRYSQPFIHFWFPLLIYYLGYFTNKNKESNIIESLICSIIIIGLYGCIMNKDRYGFVIRNHNIVRDYSIYLLMHIIITVIYFNYL